MLNSHDAKLARIEFTKRHPQGKDDQRVPEFYARVFEQLKLQSSMQPNIAFIVVGHFVHSLPYFLESLSALGKIAALISKKSGVVKSVRKSIESIYRSIIDLSVNKETLAEDSEVLDSFLTRVTALADHRFVIIDHGGYFAPQLHQVVSRFSKKIIGIVEHTWNGEVRYTQQLVRSPFPIPIYSVAHSKLKGLETQDVAFSIVDSLTNSLYGGGLNQSIRHLDKILIMGYGHIGEAVANILKARLKPHGRRKIYICDVSAEVIDKARLHFDADHCSTQKLDFLSNAELIITATSARVLDQEDFARLKPGVIIACATSSDDQFTPNALSDFTRVNPGVAKSTQPCVEYQSLTSPLKVLYLVADGDSVNFLHGSTPSPIIHCVFSSIISITARCISQQPSLLTTILHSQGDQDEQIQILYESIFGPLVDDALVKLSLEGWKIPADNVDKFVGREDILLEIHQRLSQTTSLSLTNQHALLGLGGVGKSSIAIRYLHQFRKNYFAVFWFDAYKNLEEQFYQLAEKLQIRTTTRFRHNNSYFNPETQPLGQETLRPIKEIVRAIYKKLRQSPSTVLMIFDNADCYEGIKEFLPPHEWEYQSTKLKILFTTRERFAADVQMMDIGLFSPAEARQYIEKNLPPSEHPHADLLAKTVGYLPLAIAQAVWYIKLTRTVNTIPKYLKKFETQQVSLLKNYLPHENESDRSRVLTTWDVTLATIKELCPAAAKIMQYSAYFEANAIPLSLFTNLCDEHNVDLEETVALLDQYSLITLSEDGQTFNVHRLLQDVIQIHSRDPQAKIKRGKLPLSRANVTILNELCVYLSKQFTLDIDSPDSIESCSSQLAHIEKFLTIFKTENEILLQHLTNMSITLSRFFIYIRRDRQKANKFLDHIPSHNDPEIYGLQAFSEYLCANFFSALLSCNNALSFGDENQPDIALSDNYALLGLILFNYGDAGRALSAFVRAGEIMDHIDPSLLQFPNRRGTLFHNLGLAHAIPLTASYDLQQAETHFLSALQIYSTLFTKPCLQGFLPLCSLIYVYISTGELKKARHHFEAAEQIAECLFADTEHDEKIRFLILKANLYHHEGNSVLATETYKKARILAQHLEHTPLEIAALIRLFSISIDPDEQRFYLFQALELLPSHHAEEVKTILSLYLFLLDLKEGKDVASSVERILDETDYLEFPPYYITLISKIHLDIANAWLLQGNDLMYRKFEDKANTVTNRESASLLGQLLCIIGGNINHHLYQQLTQPYVRDNYSNMVLMGSTNIVSAISGTFSTYRRAHMDMRSSNVMLSLSGTFAAKLTDFGISRSLQNQAVVLHDLQTQQVLSDTIPSSRSRFTLFATPKNQLPCSISVSSALIKIDHANRSIQGCFLCFENDALTIHSKIQCTSMYAMQFMVRFNSTQFPVTLLKSDKIFLHIDPKLFELLRAQKNWVATLKSVYLWLDHLALESAGNTFRK